VIVVVGDAYAVGRMNRKVGNERDSMAATSDHPAPVSPRPCKKITEPKCSRVGPIVMALKACIADEDRGD